MTKSQNTTCDTSFTHHKRQSWLTKDLKVKLSKLLQNPRRKFLKRELKLSALHMCTETEATKKVKNLIENQEEIWRVAYRIVKRKQPYEETLAYLRQANIAVPAGWDKAHLTEWLLNSGMKSTQQRR